ncbi:MAG: hypothetical protein JWN48_2850, partial [Myxococcaceae bacterium]|nr:hypothetical protein [Myxococcaceae bacterium]
MTVRQELSLWQPRELVLQAVKQTLDVFVAGCESQFLLLVLLDELNSELATGLLAVEASRGGEGDGLGFRTVVRDLDATLLAEKIASSDPKAKPARPWSSSLTSAGAAADRPVDRIPAELLRAPAHVLPIKKRAEGSFLQH